MGTITPKISQTDENNGAEALETTKGSLGSCFIDLDKLLVRSTKIEIPVAKQPASVAFQLDPNQSKVIACIVERVESDEGEFIKEEFHPVASALHEVLAEDLRLITFHAGMNQYNQPFIHPQKMPGLDGYADSWTTSAQDVADKGQKSWIRTKANFTKKSYDIVTLNLHKRPITWFNFDEALENALGSNVVDSAEHPTIQRLGIVTQSQSNEV